MRKQFQLNKETDEILRYLKKEYEKENDVKATYGFIVNRIVEKLNPDFSKIDWKLVRDTKSNKAPKRDKSSKEYNTALNLTISADNNIIELTNVIPKELGLSKVYKAFVVKMILRAYYLKDIQKVDIYKK